MPCQRSAQVADPSNSTGHNTAHIASIRTGQSGLGRGPPDPPSVEPLHAADRHVEPLPADPPSRVVLPSATGTFRSQWAACPGAPVHIGRVPDNEPVVDGPVVSR